MQTVTMTFFRFKGPAKIWAMRQMRDSKKKMSQESGLLFFKMLGTGGHSGYSLWPDFSVYAQLCVWNTAEDAHSFFNHSAYFIALKSRSVQRFTIFMKAVSSRGSWTGQSPFNCIPANPENPYYCVLTRATLKPGFLYQFWKRVPAVSHSQENYPGLIFSKGVGEVPFFEQATFTVWNDLEKLQEFAYKSRFHAEAVKKTREMDGFREEMFSRFQPIEIEGNWDYPLLDEFRRNA